MLAASRENMPNNWLFRITDCRTSDGLPVQNKKIGEICLLVLQKN